MKNRSMEDYTVISSDNLYTLKEEIKYKLDWGYELQGGVSVTVKPNYTIIYSQAVVKYMDKE